MPNLLEFTVTLFVVVFMWFVNFAICRTDSIQRRICIHLIDKYPEYKNVISFKQVPVIRDEKHIQHVSASIVDRNDDYCAPEEWLKQTCISRIANEILQKNAYDWKEQKDEVSNSTKYTMTINILK